MITLRLNPKLSRSIAATIAVLMFSDTVCPVAAWALTGGPSQPEVQSFEPIGTSDMVDIFSGDFNYNIPLLDMDGYPVNLAYHSGITMDQEASWVGLGWNINPGVINRNMRGIPDDFKGDVITKEFNMKPDRTFGLNGGWGTEIFGNENASSVFSLSINFSIGVTFNNYRGMGIEKSITTSLSAGKKGLGGFNGSLGLTSSSDNGLSIQPGLGLSYSKTYASKLDGATSSFGVNVGTSFNSRSGIKKLSINTSIDKGYRDTRDKGNVASSSLSIFGTSSSFDYGSYTYTPSVDLPMHNFSISANFKVGGEVFGLHGNFTMGGYFSSQKLITNTTSNPAYGYMHYDEGVNYNNAVLDFNRENDRSFVQHLPAMALSSLTFDMYAVSGQGVGGSYRPFRSDVGYVYDAAAYSTSDGLAIGGEYGFGNVAHAGGDITVNNTYTSSGRWVSGNNAQSRMRYTDAGGYATYEPWYFKEANEKSVDSDPGFYQAYGNDKPQYFELDQVSNFNTQLAPQLVDQQGNTTSLPSSNTRDARDKRNQVIFQLTKSELERGFGLDSLNTDGYDAPDHHIAEITTYGTDGMRYVYGQPAYNITQTEVSFAVGEDRNGNGGSNGDCETGLVKYFPANNDDSKDNTRGVDNYFNKTTTPAYAHSYLLTAVLSPEYVDADDVKGPSTGDLGYYTQFHYSDIDDYEWRVPVQQDTATFNEGLRSDPTDDKASYVYGKKELWYLDSIVSKNYIAIFTKEARKDGCGVVDSSGGIETSSAKAMRLLRKISLYSLHDYRDNGANAIPIKEVHFEYDYSLCPNVPNNTGVAEGTLNANKGKLTLKKVYFTYQNSNKARLSPYTFTYSSNNPSYNLKGYDRWGNYKPNSITSCAALSADIPASEYPYVEQNQTTADTYTSSWSLEEINLPSGGKISVEYESDDYAYVQDKRAMQMFRIVGVDNAGTSADLRTSADDLNISDGTNKNRKLLIELPLGFTDIDDYLDGISNLYFRCLMRFDPNDTTRCDYVSGYAQVDRANCSISADTTAGGKPVLKLALTSVKLNDNGSADYNPITKAAIQFGRMNLSRFVWDQPNLSGDEGFGQQFLTALVNSSFVKTIGDAIQGPNLAIWNKDRGKQLITHKSFVRLNNPNHKKLGGGSRVKRIELSDEFSALTGTAMPSFAYGQEYEYELADGTSSGVASYEPQLGGDENPWKQPISFNTENLLAPDDNHYIETPLGESFFPSASVGYSRVTVTNLQHANVTRNATGKVVHEFYTAKDFPTIVDRTDLIHDQDKTDPFSITSILYTYSRDHMTATQGFSVELNDMHGKQKKQMVYQEGQAVPITEVEYKYQSTLHRNGSPVLDNNVTVIDKQGNVSTAQVGVFYDMAADMREFRSEVSSTALQLNLDAFIFPPLPAVLPVPMIWPSLSYEETQFRSATTTKIIQRFGILEEVIAKDLGSRVSTQNLAYDSETGELLLTSATTDFNDTVYSLTYPAHWHYDGMGQAYRNIGFSQSLSFTTGVANVTSAKTYYVPGDELLLAGSTDVKGWVTDVGNSSITVVDKAGNLVVGSYDSKIIRSGRRNLAGTPIASITMLANPLDHFRQNIFRNVIQASAAEFSNEWRTFCDCFDNPDGAAVPSTNPYVLGILGNWRLKRSLLHLTQRTQSSYNDNTNIRKDGFFTSYTPFYKLQNNSWVIDERDWTFTSEVTEFSPYGPELENRDALGRYSAATFGYRQTMPTGVAANSRYRDIATDNFEDYGFSACADNHFKFTADTLIVDTVSHTGRKSIRVSSGTPVLLVRQLEVCDPAGCSISISTSSITGGKNISLANGTSPYQIEWNVIQGNPTITFNGSSIDVVGTGWTVEVIAVDSEGCKVSGFVSN